MGDLGSLMLGGVMMTVSFLLRPTRVALLIGGRYLYRRIYDICYTGLLFFSSEREKGSFATPFHRSLRMDVV